MAAFPRLTGAVSLAALAAAAFPLAAAGPDKAALIEDALSAAPPGVRETASVMAEDGTMLKEGSGAFVCMPTAAAIRELGSQPMCLDQVWLKWADAWMNKKPFTAEQVGIAYMLMGDAAGASNVDPHGDTPTADNQWVVEGPHVMLLVPDPALLEGLPDTPDGPGPYVMWKGTPYAHIMLPVGERPAQRKPEG
ncbi:hypothetical protein [Marinimicrococcus flavescens]|uniref:Lipoprotein n=1 Tax=Marinimicrococcus flavescens TaxID=3031815 RepID=A0AAP3XSP2_9PROT|nr:hypothetical protein [Marinimicrococcus flavescens]